jgi:putative membrane protein
MIRHLTLASGILLVILALQGCSRDRNVEAARENRPPAASPAAQDFMMKTADTDLSEIDMARLALQKSTNADIRDYANMVQSDDTAALENLSDLMKEKGVSQPQVASVDARQDLSRMSGLSGPEFDREFINMMVADHQKAIDRFHDQIAIAQDPDVKKYAEDLLPKLEMHLEKAQRLQSKLFSMPG